MKSIQHFSSLIALVVVTLALSSCASLQSTSLSSIPKERNSPVSAQVKRTIFLGFNFDNDFINPLADDLKSQCQGGEVRGILTKDEIINYFLFIVWERRVTATGHCVKGRA